MDDSRSNAVTVQYSAASAASVATWLCENYDLGTLLACELFRPGWPTLHRIESARGVVWLRTFATERPALATAEAQAQAIHGAFLRGAALAPPLARRDGAFAGLFELGEGPVTAIVFANAPGHELATPQDTEAFGESLAKLHMVALSSKAHDHLPVIDAETLLRRPLSRLRAWPASATILPEVEATAQRLIDTVWRKDVSMPIGLCHGDVHVANARVADGVVTLFDFDVCGTGPLAYDLACAWRKCLLAHDDREVAVLEWRSFLSGYGRVRAVTGAEHRAICALAALRAIWTMAMPTEFADVWGTHMLRDPTYFEAHLGMIRRLAATQCT